MRWCVKGLLPDEGIAAVYGPSTSGKSFLALDLACAIAEGRTWFGRRVTPHDVVYAVLEGDAGFSARLAAWEQHNRRALPKRLKFIVEPMSLLDDVMKLTVSLYGIDRPVVFIDTLNASIPGADENSSRDMGMAIEAAKNIARFTIGGLLVLVAHTGKDESRGLRGHSSLFAALDAAIQTTRDGDTRSWCAAKAKDGLDGDTCGFRLRQVFLGVDSDGDTITSCVVEQVDAPDRPVRRLGEVEGAVLEFLIARRVGVKKTEIAQHFDGRYRRTSVYRALKALVKAGAAHESVGMVAAAAVAK